MDKNTQHEKKEGAPSLMIPGAIVVAGIIVAGAIVFSNAPIGALSNASPSAPKSALGEELYKTIAKQLRLPENEFASCLSDTQHRDRVLADFNDAVAAGGTGTPYNIVLNAKGELFPFSGAIPYEQITAIIKDALEDDEVFGNNNSAAASAMRPIDESDHVRGNPDAPVTLVEYSDLECPFCARHHPNVIRLLREFDGDVKWVYRHFPLSSIHPEAISSAVASECAAELGGEEAFWDFVDEVFSRTS